MNALGSRLDSCERLGEDDELPRIDSSSTLPCRRHEVVHAAVGLCHCDNGHKRVTSWPTLATACAPPVLPSRWLTWEFRANRSRSRCRAHDHGRSFISTAEGQRAARALPPETGRRRSRNERRTRGVPEKRRGSRAASPALSGSGAAGARPLITPAMQALSVGLPKVMVSTMASGNKHAVRWLDDITLMYSVVDVAGLNSVSRRVLGNAAAAIAGMVRFPLLSAWQAHARHDDVRRDDPVRHPGTRSSRRAGLRLPRVPRHGDRRSGDGEARRGRPDPGRSGRDHHRGRRPACRRHAGVRAGAVEAILQAGVPYVLSLGALDMVNFGAIETVPERFRGRKLHVHNSQVTLMRTTIDENRRCAAGSPAS